jgi:toxin-antitoxin system PIN domain toxin
MIGLLDVNVLIALVDPGHVHHDAAHAWFNHEGRQGWASCPITQNGLVRIVSHPKYPNATSSVAEAVDLLRRLTAVSGHTFWPDTVSLCDPAVFLHQQTRASAHTTDTYLLGLAVSRGGRLVTFDRRLSSAAVRGGKERLLRL